MSDQDYQFLAASEKEVLRQSEELLAWQKQQTQKLEQTLRELQRTQAQLVQSEKMVALGQLVEFLIEIPIRQSS